MARIGNKMDSIASPESSMMQTMIASIMHARLPVQAEKISHAAESNRDNPVITATAISFFILILWLGLFSAMQHVGHVVIGTGTGIPPQYIEYGV